ncbi:venom peptide CtAPI isoform X2 [Megalopta genalis]|uniref:venom peptide CtAPI isoform X2 n=1 Tax=Megalopta genalis TaxID=115081 RepID=UPI003FD2DBA8
MISAKMPDEVLTAPADPSNSTEGSIECRKHEEPTDCVSCSPSCERLIPGKCNGPLCRPGCKCSFGFYKDSDGDCVSILGCVIDFMKSRKEWSVFDFVNTAKQLQSK